MTNETTVRYLGTSDDVSTCDCCGRTELKSTVALLIGEAVEPVYFGAVCAARRLKSTAKKIRAATRTADDAKHAARLATQRARWEAERAAHQSWLDARVPALRGETFRQIESLGGWLKVAEMKEAEGVAA